MATQDQSFARDFLAETLAIPAGVNATITPVAGQVAVQIKYLAGGSLALLGSTFAFNGVVQGTTFATAQRYLFGTSEVLSINCKATFTLESTGVTTTVALIRALSAPKSML